MIQQTGWMTIFGQFQGYTNTENLNHRVINSVKNYLIIIFCHTEKIILNFHVVNGGVLLQKIFLTKKAFLILSVALTSNLLVLFNALK